jgi:hypothetical protein
MIYRCKKPIDADSAIMSEFFLTLSFQEEIDTGLNKYVRVMTNKIVVFKINYMSIIIKINYNL